MCPPFADNEANSLKDHKICCNLKRKIKCLEKQKRKLIKDLNQDLIRAYESKSLEEILQHSEPEILFLSECQRLKEIIETDVQIRNCKHEQLLAATPDVDTHLDNTIDENKPRPNQAVHKVTELLERACKEISKDDDLFSCHLVGVGSYHDRTKMFHYDEMDFVFLLNHEPETEYSAEVVKKTRGVPACYVLPVEGTDFYKRCEDERLLRPGGKLDVLSYRHSFIRTLKSTLQRLCDEMNIDCSGCMDFHFSGFMENGPALTFSVNDISVDITLSFKAPQSLMADVMQKNADPQLVRRLEKCFPDFRSLGLLVLPPCGECVLSTSWIETHFIYENTTLQNTLKICKYYKELYFNLDWPCLKEFYKFLVNKIQDHILCRLQSDEQRAMEVENQIMNMVWQSEEHSTLLLFLATRPRPLIIDDNTFSKLLKLM